MTAKCPAQVVAKEVPQVSMVVKDIQQTVESFWNILGIGPWVIFPFGSTAVPDLKYYGNPTSSTYKVARTQLGSIEFELIQPVHGNSIYQDWLDKHGEGFHQMKFVAGNLDVEGVERKMAEIGFPSIQSGHYGPELKYKFCVFDTSRFLRCIWETDSGHSYVPAGAVTYPSNPKEKSPAKIKVKAIQQIALVVKDVQRTIENYWEILGMGPWELRDWGSFLLPNRLYYGKPAWVKERQSHVFIGGLDIEVLMTIEGDSIYQDWIDEHGEGIHHVKYLVDDLEENCKILTEQGFPCILRAPMGPPEAKSGFTYFYIEPLHSMWEAVRRTVGRLGEPTFYPAELAYDIEKTTYR